MYTVSPKLRKRKTIKFFFWPGGNIGREYEEKTEENGKPAENPFLQDEIIKQRTIN